jgi:SAM-dependent methyltransferase
MGRQATRADPQSFDHLAVDYDRYASLEPPVILEWLLAQLPGRGRRALDAGCGSGRHALALADRFDEVVGIDISQPLIDLARQQRPHLRVHYQVGDLLAITNPGRFDLVLSSTTLHHLPDLEVALHHLRGLAANGAPRSWSTTSRLGRPRPAGSTGSGRSASSPPTCAATAGSRRGGCSGSGPARPGWTTSPATATCLARPSNSATAPSFGCPIPRARSRPRPRLAQPGIATKRFCNTV